MMTYDSLNRTQVKYRFHVGLGFVSLFEEIFMQFIIDKLYWC